jgi:hypothetical protein
MRLFAVAAALILVLGFATPAHAATYTQKLQVATGWTQASAESQGSWNGARLDQARWSGYAFDWSTDYCSSSPDQPLGFDFRLPCHRHDFGYRNFKRLSAFPANKPRVDDAFYYDMKQICARYSWTPRQACLSTAWTYYQAVKKYGALLVPQSELARIAEQHAA